MEINFSLPPKAKKKGIKNRLKLDGNGGMQIY